ncbi:ShlB/FhaC/HecB family hemolysin secretion/activation protein [Pseudomonas machongensis]
MAALHHLVFRLVTGALFASLCAAPAWAASPGDQDLIRDRQDRLLQEQQRRLEELRNLPGKVGPETQAPPPEDTRCFTIRTIELKGADSLAQAEREQLLAPFIGQCLGVTQLNALLKAITDHYLDRGLVTSRAYLPQQDLSGGHLQVLVVEGRLEGLRPDDDSRLSSHELAMAFPGRAGSLLNLREIEQMVDQLNRLPSNKAQMELTPGEAVGGSQVQVRNQAQKPWRASLSRNNEGQRSTGEQQLNLGLEWDSPLGLADQLVLRGGHDVVSDHTQGSKNGVLFYNLPWGWWNFTYSYSESEYRSLAEANGFGFKQTGNSQNHQLRAERVVHRDATSKTSLSAGIAHLRTNNYIEDSRLEASSNRLSEAQFGLNHGRRLGNAFVNLDLGTQEGIGAFDAQDNGHPRPGEPVARYRKYSATLSYVQGFQVLGENLSFSSLATGQRSEDVLFSPQRISLGGLSSVRGLKDQSLSGDSGGYWRNDLRWTRPVNWPLLQPLVAEYGLGLGYDLGVIRNDRYNGDRHGRAGSHSLELFARGQHLSASVTFAHSLERPGALPDKERPVYFRLDLFI